MVSIKINDIFHELIDENKRLIEENKIIYNLLVKYRKSLLNLQNICVCNQKSNDFVIKSLEDKYQTITKHRPKKSSVNQSNGSNDNEVTDSENDHKFSDDVKEENQEIDDQLSVTYSEPKVESSEVFKCEECHKEFNFKSNLFKHKNAVHQSTHFEYNCDYCSFKTTAKEYLQKHKKRVHLITTKNFKCDYKNCHKMFKTLGAMENHKLFIHLKIRPKIGRPRKQPLLSEQLEKAKLKKAFECDFKDCHQVFRTLNAMNKHKLQSHANERPKMGRPRNDQIQSGERYVCDYIGCNTSFKLKRSLKLHIQRRHTLQKPFKCEECHYCFVTQSELKSHQRVHTKQKMLFECKECHKEFQTKYNYDKHKRIMHSSEPVIYKCCFCEFETRFENLFKGHTRRMHTMTERTVKCDYEGCNRTYRDRLHLNKHKSLRHSNKRHTCDWPGCDYSTHIKSSYADHKRSHLGIRQFVCDYKDCRKAFIREKSLYQHKRSHWKKYICSWPECSLRFTLEVDLTAHMNTHLNVRPFKCTFNGCKKDFRIDKHLKHHIRVIHKIKPKQLNL